MPKVAAREHVTNSLMRMLTSAPIMVVPGAK
jgi:hypothetical protein